MLHLKWNVICTYFFFFTKNVVDSMSRVHSCWGQRLALGSLLLSPVWPGTWRQTVPSTGRDALLSKLLWDGIFISLWGKNIWLLLLRMLTVCISSLQLTLTCIPWSPYIETQISSKWSVVKVLVFLCMVVFVFKDCTIATTVLICNL